MGWCRCLAARAITAGAVQYRERRQERGLIKVYKIMKDIKLLLTKSHGMRVRRHLMKTVQDHF